MSIKHLVVASLVLGTLAACKEEEAPAPPTFLDPPESALALTPATRALFATPIRSLYTTREVFTADLELANQVVLQVQSLGELAYARSVNVNESTFSSQVESFWDEDFGQAILDRDGTSVTLVLDLQRLNREWLVDWRGQTRDEPGVRETSFTFAARANQEGSDYQQDLVNEVIDALDVLGAEESPVIRLVVGAEMERHYLAAPQDWPSFVAFLRLLQSRLDTQFPNVQVSVGINWSNFMERVVPAFLDPADPEAEVDFLTVQRAWNTVIDPLYYSAEDVALIAEGEADEPVALLDFHAFAALPDPTMYADSPAAIPDTHFAGIPTMFDEDPWRAALPVVWYSVGWPVSSERPEVTGQFMERFLALNGTEGYSPAPNHALVAWWGYNNPLDNECTQLASADLAGDLEVCYRGLYGTIPQISNRTRLILAFFGQ